MVHYSEIMQKINSVKRELVKKYHVKTIGIFGSYSRNEQNKSSDIDILVEFNETVDFFEFLDLEEYLENILHVKVDLVTRKALKPLMRNAVLKETQYI